MPYKNKADRNANQQKARAKQRQKDRIGVICKMDGCSKPIGIGKRWYCGDACQNKFHIATQKKKNDIDKANEAPRFCKHDGCGKELPSTLSRSRAYCIDTKCYEKQNRIDAKNQRDARPKKEKIKPCKRCEKDFEYKIGANIYCKRCKEIRKNMSPSAKYVSRKIQAEDWKGKSVNPIYLTRGKPHYAGYGRL